MILKYSVSVDESFSERKRNEQIDFSSDSFGGLGMISGDHHDLDTSESKSTDGVSHTVLRSTSQIRQLEFRKSSERYVRILERDQSDEDVAVEWTVVLVEREAEREVGGRELQFSAGDCSMSSRRHILQVESQRVERRSTREVLTS